MDQTRNRNPEGVAEDRAVTSAFTNMIRSPPNLFATPFRVGIRFVLNTQGSALARATLG
jgi:hypothetical protein